jgi:hypothetical protein
MVNTFRFVNGRFVLEDKSMAFVTFANGRYRGHDVELRESVTKVYPSVPVFCFHEFEEIGSPPHSENPYAFKVFCIEAVRRMGYSVVVWVDSINRLEKSLDPILPRVAQVGVYLQGDEHPSGLYANDRSLAYFGISRDAAMEIEAIYACVMLFDFRNPTASEFLARWKQACLDGIFKGHWTNANNTESQDPRCKGHRHDQTCVEFISHQLGIPRSRALLGGKSEKYFTSFRYP